MKHLNEAQDEKVEYEIREVPYSEDPKSPDYFNGDCEKCVNNCGYSKLTGQGFGCMGSIGGYKVHCDAYKEVVILNKKD